ncbi:MAG: Ig-like domain-containing protein [Verrucomicrobiota bacterium]
MRTADLSAYKSFGAVVITNQPANVSVEEGRPATFTSGANGVDGTLPYAYQWYRDGVAISGATGVSYTLNNTALTDTGVKFYYVVSNAFSSAASSNAVLTVNKDVAKPAVASAGSILTNAITVVFSEPVEQASATTVANYQLQTVAGASVEVTGATLASDNKTVNLVTASLTTAAEYKVLVSNVKDQAATPNVMADYTSPLFKAHNFEHFERINNNQSYSALPVGNQMRIVGGGADIWGTADQFVYLYKQVTGNFDFIVKGESLVNSDVWAKMGPMARESTAPGSRHVFLAVTPQAGNNYYSAQGRPGTGVASVSDILENRYQGIYRPAASYPNSWLRLQRIGSVFYEYTSTNGINWRLIYSNDTQGELEGAMPDSILVGLAVTSHTTGATTEAVLSGFAEVPRVPLSVATPPQSQTVPENRPVTFTVAAAGSQPYIYEWLRNGTPIDGATNVTLTIAETPFADNGALISCRISNGYGETVTSAVAVLTVVQDTVRPTFRMGQLPRITISPDQVVLLFSEFMDPTSAQNIANYTIATDTGSLSVLSAALGADRRTVTLTTVAQTAGKTYTITVNNVTDIAATPNPVAPNSKDFFFYAGTAGKFVQRADGYVVMEAENATRITPATDGDEWEFRNSPAGYSGIGYVVVPNGRGGGNPGTGAHLEFDIEFNRTGVHTVWVRGWNENTATAGSDDSVYVGFDAVAVGTGNQASLSGFPASGWVWRSDRQEGTDPVTINVTTVGLHTLNIWHREDGTLVDKLIIQPPPAGTSGTAAPAAATANSGLGQIETQDYLATPPVAPTVSISSPANNQVFAANSSIPITAGITAPSQIALVEFLSGTSILGQVTAIPYSLTVPNVPEGIYNYTVRVTDVLGYIVTSSAVRVVVDSTKPVMQALASSFDGSVIGVLFREPVAGLDAVTAANVANYTINGGAIAVTSARLEPDNVTVTLVPATPVSGQFTVKAENVADMGFGPNVMAATTLTGNVVVSALIARDVGTPNTNNPALFTDPVMPGFTLAINATDFYIGAGGHDIWDAADGFHFLYQEKTGDFDVWARVESLTRPNEWAKASLMVREDLDGGSRNAVVLTAPTTGQNLINFQWRDVKNAASASLATAQRPTPTPIPNCWLRLQRSGNVISGYWGTNGTTWTVLTNYTPTAVYPAKTYVGLAVTSHNNTSGLANTVRTVLRDIRGFDLPVAPPTSPTLQAKQVGTNVEISWTSESNKIVLQSSANLLPANWQPVGITPAVNGNVYTVQVPISGTPQFFRAVAP